MTQLSENSLKILQRRYLRKDAQRHTIETPDELFHRVANAIAAAEWRWGKSEEVDIWASKFYKIMSELWFLPNSPTLMNAGMGSHQLSACFVLPVEDSLEGIFTSLKHAALIQQSGGGTGFNFSHLRPQGDELLTTGGTASGPISFMKIFDAATEHVKQGGKRRGANMGILNINHPDIEAFIGVKKAQGVLNNFNISVGISDDFMHAVEHNTVWHLIHPNTKLVVKEVNALELWLNIVQSAWQTGDPGLIFMDTINHNNPTPALGEIETTNPCGEVPLLPFESCNLGSINLSKCIVEEKGKNALNWRQLKEIIHIAVRFLDNVIEVNHYTIPEIRAITLGNRKIGLGVMGWAELLILLGIPYDCEDAVSLAEQLMRFIEQESTAASMNLAKERGVFPNWEKSIYFANKPIRHATRTSIAPTGTISILADTSSSIEPLFALAFQRQHVLNDETLFSINPHFLEHLKKQGLYSEKIVQQIIESGVAGGIEELPEVTKQIFKTALEISPMWHLRHQISFQKYTDNAVSKTINLPEHATVKDVENMYKAAWQLKAKGITIFRYNSKGKQVLNKGIALGNKACKVCIEQ